MNLLKIFYILVYAVSLLHLVQLTSIFFKIRTDFLDSKVAVSTALQKRQIEIFTQRNLCPVKVEEKIYECAECARILRSELALDEIRVHFEHGKRRLLTVTWKSRLTYIKERHAEFSLEISCT